MEPGKDYLSFMLRLWRIDDGDSVTWRASLERPGTRICQGFASLEALFTYLRQQTGRQIDLAGVRRRDPGKEID